MSELCSQVSGWISTKIVSKETPEERAQVIDSFISIGMQLLDYHNYSAAMMVLSALNSSPVARLRGSWEVCIYSVSLGFHSYERLCILIVLVLIFVLVFSSLLLHMQQLSPKSTADFGFMTFLLTADKNFKNYRKAVQEVNPSETCIVYLGVFLTDYTFTCDSKPIFYDNLVNLERLNVVGQKLREFMSYQDRPFPNLQATPSVRDAIMSERILESNELFNLSKLREEKGGYSETVSGGLGVNFSAAKKKRASRNAKHIAMVDLSGTDNLVLNISGQLGDREWSLITTNSTVRSFKDKEIIMTEEVPCSTFYR